MSDVLDDLVAEALAHLVKGETDWDGYEPPLRAGLTMRKAEMPPAGGPVAHLVRRVERIYSDFEAAIYAATFSEGPDLQVLAATHDRRTLRYFYPHFGFGTERLAGPAMARVMIGEETGSRSVGRPITPSEFAAHAEDFAWDFVVPSASMYFINGLMPSQHRGFNWLYADDGFDVIPGIATTVTALSWDELVKSDPGLEVFASFARDEYRLEVPVEQQTATVRIAIYQAPDGVRDPYSYFYSGTRDAPLPELFSTTMPTA